MNYYLASCYGNEKLDCYRQSRIKQEREFRSAILCDRIKKIALKKNYDIAIQSISYVFRPFFYFGIKLKPSWDDFVQNFISNGAVKSFFSFKIHGFRNSEMYDSVGNDRVSYPLKVRFIKIIVFHYC